MLDLYNVIREYAENLRLNNFFDLSIKYYKKYLSYNTNDQEAYYLLFLSSINCSNLNNEYNYLHNLRDINYFQNLVAFRKTDNDKEEFINRYIDFIVKYINETDSNFLDDNIYFVFEEIIKFYPISSDECFVKSLEKLTDVSIRKKHFLYAKKYATNLISLDNQNATFYWYKLLATLNCSTDLELVNQKDDFTKNSDYINAINYANGEKLSYYLSIKKEWLDVK